MDAEAPSTSGSSPIPCFVVARKGYVWDAEGGLACSLPCKTQAPWQACMGAVPPGNQPVLACWVLPAGAIRLRKDHHIMGNLVGGVARECLHACTLQLHGALPRDACQMPACNGAPASSGGSGAALAHWESEGSACNVPRSRRVGTPHNSCTAHGIGQQVLPTLDAWAAAEYKNQNDARHLPLELGPDEVTLALRQGKRQLCGGSDRDHDVLVPWPWPCM